MKAVFLDAQTMGDDLDWTSLHACSDLSVYALTSPAQLKGRIAEAEIILVNKVPLRGEALQAAAKLRLICVAATGYDNIDLVYCRTHGIAVCNVLGYSTDSVAQLTAAMALSLYMRLPEFSQYVASGAYTASGIPNKVMPPFRELRGKTWGILGGGNIGRQVATVASAFGCRVIVCRRTKDPLYPTVDVDTLCASSDILTVHVPLNEGTRGILSRERIASMKPGAVLVNTARGAVADEAALAKAVQSGKLGGLGCDVYSREPFSEEHPFYAIRNHPNVCLTPHMAWGAYEARQRCLEEIAENIRTFVSGGRRCRVD